MGQGDQDGPLISYAVDVDRLSSNVEDNQVEAWENKSESGLQATIPCYTCKLTRNLVKLIYWSTLDFDKFYLLFIYLIYNLWLILFVDSMWGLNVMFSCIIQIPQTGWDKLYISFIPADSGKATLKTTKANVRNGTCKWADPIYETTRLLQDINTKQYDERLYKLVVTMVFIYNSYS